MLKRRLVGCAGLVVSVLLISGCGGPPPVKSAAKEIDEAERDMKSAARYASEGNYDSALSTCKQAQEPITKGKSFATGVELTKLNNLNDDMRNQLNIYAIKKTTQAKPVTANVGPASDVLDPAEVKRREAVRKEALEQERLKKAEEEKKSVLVEAKKLPKADDPEDAADGGAVADAGVAGVAKADKADGGDAPKKSTGLFPAITEKSPPVEIVKVLVRDRAAVAYVQVYVPGDQTRRIMAVVATFKDKDHNDICDNNMLAYEYKGFAASNPDPTIQHSNVVGITMGSHELRSHQSLQIAIPVSHPKARDIKMVFVKIAYQDGEPDRTDVVVTPDALPPQKKGR